MPDPECLNARTPERPTPDVLELLAALQDRSLLVLEEGGEAERYRLLEPLREFGWERLAASGELAAVRRAHHDWYLQLALRVEDFRFGPEQPKWGARLEAEIDNVRAALSWSLEQAEADPEGDGAAATLRLVSASWWLWHARARFAEGLRWLESALDRGRHLPPAVRACALFQASHLCAVLGEREGDRCLSFRQASRREYEASLATARCEGARRAVAEAALSLSELTGTLQDLDASEQYGAEARQLFAELQEPFGVADALRWLAAVALKRQDRPSARALLEEQLAIYRKLSVPWLLIHALGGLGHVEREEGNYARAGALYRESLLLRRELGALIALEQSLEDLAGLASRQQQHARAVRLLGAAEAFGETLGARPPVTIVEEYERTVVGGRAALGEAAFAAAWAEGGAMSLDAAVAYALAEE